MFLRLGEIKDLKKEKSIEKYGVDNVAKAKEVKVKTERTNLEYKERNLENFSSKMNFLDYQYSF